MEITYVVSNYQNNYKAAHLGKISLTIKDWMLIKFFYKHCSRKIVTGENFSAIFVSNKFGAHVKVKKSQK